MKENIYKTLYKSPIFLLGSTDSKVTFQKLLFGSLWCGGSPPCLSYPTAPLWGTGCPGAWAWPWACVWVWFPAHLLPVVPGVWLPTWVGLGGGCVGCPSSTFSASPLPVALVPDLPRACT